MKRHLLIAVLLLAGALAPVAASAKDLFGGGRGERPLVLVAGGQIPLSRVLAMIAQRTPGRPLNTTLGDSGGRPAYFVQWLMTSGRVVVFIVDAESGAVIGQQGG
jgi:uncharacterized membrane protein YkoI